MRIFGLIAVAVAVLVAGCTSSSANKPDPKPTTHATPAKPIDPANASVLELGKDLPLVANLPSKIGKQNANFIGVASPNVLFGVLTRPEKGGRTKQSHPFVYNITSRSIIRLDDDLKRPAKTQVLDVVSSAATIVWAEAPVSPGPKADITVYTYERTSGVPRPRILDPVPAGDDLSYGADLAAVDGKILLSVKSVNQKTGKGAGIYSGSIEGGKPLKVLVEDGQRLTVDGDQMTYSINKKKFVRDLDSGDTKSVPPNSHANDGTFCGAESVSVFAIRCEGTVANGSLLTVKDPAGHSTSVGPFTGLPPNDLRMVGPWLDIGSTDGRVRGQEYLFSPASKKIEALPKGTSLDTTPAAELAPDLALLSAPGTHVRQWLVHIPST